MTRFDGHSQHVDELPGQSFPKAIVVVSQKNTAVISSPTDSGKTSPTPTATLDDLSATNSVHLGQSLWMTTRSVAYHIERLCGSLISREGDYHNCLNRTMRNTTSLFVKTNARATKRKNSNRKARVIHIIRMKCASPYCLVS